MDQFYAMVVIDDEMVDEMVVDEMRS